MDELSEDDKLTVSRSPKNPTLLLSAILRCRTIYWNSRECMRNLPTRFVVSTIIEGELDYIGEKHFMYKGSIEDVVASYKKVKGE